jgi:inositol transport system substrate-binding protein
MKISLKQTLVIAVAAVTAHFGAISASYAEAAKYRIAYIARAQGDSFAAWLANAVVKETKKYPDMSVTVFDGQSRNDLIESHLENAVQNKFDLIIIQPFDPAIQIDPVKRAMAKKMKVIATNPKFSDDSIPSVDANPYQQGAENAKLASLRSHRTRRWWFSLDRQGTPIRWGAGKPGRKNFLTNVKT